MSRYQPRIPTALALGVCQRIASSYHGALGNQTKNELAKADQSIAELMRLVGNARERYCKKAGEGDGS